MDFVNNLFFGYLPYIAVAVFFVGVIYHCIVSDKTIHATSTIFLKKDGLMKWGSPMFHFGIIIVFFGHLFGLFTPMFIVEWFMPLETKRILAIIIGLAAAAVALAGLLMLLVRRFSSTRVAKSEQLNTKFVSFGTRVFTCLCTIISCIFQLGYQSYIMYKCSDEFIVVFLFGFLFANTLFLLAMVIKHFSCTLSNVENQMVAVLMMVLAAVIYSALNCVTVIYLSSDYSQYCTVIIILFVLTLNLVMVYGLIFLLFFITFSMFAMVEAIVRLIICKLKKACNIMKIEYNGYYYKAEAITEKSCAICLGEYEAKEVVCITKCSKSHVFHEECIVEWSHKQSICPVCRLPLSFI